MNLSAWLTALGLPQYERVLIENAVDAELLPQLTSEDLIAMGVTAVGHRRKLLDAAALLGQSRTKSELASDSLPVGKTDAVEGEGERRPVTVLFADLAGFTHMSSTLDPEELHALLSSFFEVVDGVIERHGGTIDKHIGDCVMAVFGAPIARSDDPERAVRAAIEIHTEVARLPVYEGRPIAVHLGLASGTVVASGTGSSAHRQYTVTGEAANLASRLTSLAAAGETLLSEDIHQQLRDRLDADSAGEMAIKGLAHPVRAWRLRALRNVSDISHPFVGRRMELTQVEAALESCLETRRGATVYLRGEAGIGKSRLISEFRRMALAQGFSCHSGVVLDFGTGRGQDAIGAIVRSLLGADLRTDTEELSKAAEDAFASGLISLERSVYLNDLLGLPQPPVTREIYISMDDAVRSRGRRDTLAELVRNKAEQKLLLIVLEDLHWAEASVLAHAADLAILTAECAVVLILSSRIEGDQLDASWRGMARGASIMTVDVGPLRDEDAIAFAKSFEAGDRYLALCIERSGGHPLFLEQLLRNAEDVSPGMLPGSVQSAVLARVDTLQPGDKQALQAASILGQRFSLDALRHLIGRNEYVAQALVAQYLIRPEGDYFLFGHALIREGVYASLLQARRRDLHRRAAAWFSKRDLSLFAEHLDRGEDQAASSAYFAAAKAEAEAYHNDPALRLAERGLHLATDRQDIWRLSTLVGELMHDKGDVLASIAAFERALVIADEDVERCTAWIGLADSLRLADRYEEALATLEQAEAVASRHGLYTESARIHHLRGNLFFPLGKIEQCVEEHRSALSWARLADSSQLEAQALGGLGDAEYARGRMRAADTNFLQCVELCRARGLRRVEVANLSMIAHTRTYLADFSKALEASAAAAKLAARVGHVRAEIIAQNGTLMVIRTTGNFDHALDHYERAMTLAEVLGSKRFQAFAFNDLAMILQAEGQNSDARGAVGQALALSRESGISFIGPLILGHLAALSPDPAESKTALQEGAVILSEGGVGHNHFWFHRYAIEVALRARDWQAAERHCSALESYTTAEPLPWSSLVVAYGRAAAAYVRDRSATEQEALERCRSELAARNFRSLLPSIDALLAG